MERSKCLSRIESVYVCGVTPYDTTHVGHAHTFLIFDVLIRYLRWQGAEVRYCQNVTDVDTPLFDHPINAYEPLATRLDPKVVAQLIEPATPRAEAPASHKKGADQKVSEKKGKDVNQPAAAPATPAATAAKPAGGEA